MFRTARLFLLLSLFLVVSTIGFAQDKMVESKFYPLAKGTTWHYKLADGNKFVMKVVDHEKVDKILCARIEMQTEDPKKEPYSELVSVTADGVFRYAANKNVPDKPVQLLKLPLKVGDSWEIDSKALGDTLKGTYKVTAKEKVEVPAGTYEAFVVTTENLEAAGLRVQEKRYYAPDVGLVKQEIEIGKQKMTTILEKFEPAGK